MESKFVGVNILFILIYPNQDGNVKRYNGKKCYLPNDFTKNYKAIVNEKNVND